MTSTTPKQEDDSWRVRMYNDEHGPESDLEKRKLENYLIKKKIEKIAPGEIKQLDDQHIKDPSLLENMAKN